MTEQDVMHRRFSRRAALRATGIGTVGLAGAALIGCSSGGGGGNAGGGTTATATTATAAAKPRFGGVLKDAMVGDPPGWGVFTAGSTSTRMNSFGYDKLLEFQVGPGVSPVSVDLQPWLATAMPE